MSQMLSVAKYYKYLNSSFGLNSALTNNTLGHQLSAVGINSENQNKLDFDLNLVPSPNPFSAFDYYSEDLSQSLTQSPLISYPWSTGFWDNISGPLLEGDPGNGFSYSNGTKDLTNGFEDINSRLGGTNNSPMTYCEEQPLRLSQAPIGTPKANQLFTTSDQSIDNSYYIQPRMRRRLPTLMECVFCKNNDEEPEFYKSHILKDPESRIMCPILRAYDCPICHNKGGDYAHTVRYCPLNRAGIHVKLANIASANQESNSACIGANTLSHSNNQSKRNRRKRRCK